MGKTALVVGGTAATGLAIVEELKQRDFEVTIYHRGAHEVPGVADLEHIHGEPHFAETIASDLGDRSWDVVVATYGRIRYLAEALRGKTQQLVTVGGTPVQRRVPGVPNWESDGYNQTENKLIQRMIETEQTVMQMHAAGEYTASVVRYPYVYGPASVINPEWHVIKRAQDGRKRWLMPGGGLGLSTRCAAPNAAHTIALCLDRPEAGGGQIYTAADDRQFTFREWTEMIARLVGYEFEFVDVPWSLLPARRGAFLGTLSAVPQGGGAREHSVVSNQKAKLELGYADVVDPEAWMRVVVDYLLENPPPVDGVGNHLKPEAFDYEIEDRILAWWDAAMADAPYDLAATTVETRHPYAHPKAPGEEHEGSGT